MARTCSGNMDQPGDSTGNGEDGGESRATNEGFVVRWRVVCPPQCGVPMSRQRIHYIGLSTHHICKEEAGPGV